MARKLDVVVQQIHSPRRASYNYGKTFESDEERDQTAFCGVTFGGIASKVRGMTTGEKAAIYRKVFGVLKASDDLCHHRKDFNGFWYTHKSAMAWAVFHPETEFKAFMDICLSHTPNKGNRIKELCE